MFSGGNKDKTSTMRESTRPFYTTKKLSLNDDKEKEKNVQKDENKKTEDKNVNKNQELTKKIDNNKNQNTQVQTQKNEKEEEFKKRNTMPLSYASKGQELEITSGQQFYLIFKPAQSKNASDIENEVLEEEIK